MKRLVWVGVGVVIAVVVIHQGRKYVRRYMPASIAQRAQDTAADVSERAGHATTVFRETFTEARAQREQELMAALLADGQPASVQVKRPSMGRPGLGFAAARDEDEDALGYSF
jgi:hypothetical protein